MLSPVAIHWVATVCGSALNPTKPVKSTSTIWRRLILTPALLACSGEPPDPLVQPVAPVGSDSTGQTSPPTSGETAGQTNQTPTSDPMGSVPTPSTSEAPAASTDGPVPVGTPDTPNNDAAELDCTAPQASPARLRMLTEAQYSNTIADLFGVGGDPGAGLGLAADDISLEHRMNTAAEVAAEAASRLTEWAPCAPEGANEEACRDQIIDEVGARGFRRALSEAERAQFQSLFDAGMAAGDFSTGVDWFVTGLLQAPDFMYQVVRAEPTEPVGAVVPLTDHEYAARLAYFIWGGPPDEALMAAADSGELSTAAARDAQIARMIEDPKFLRGVQQFYSRWLPFSAFAELARDAEGFDAEVVAALQTSLELSVTNVYSQPNPNVDDLFTGDTYFLNGALADFYGAPAGGTDFVETSLADQSRRGILTHPAVMALLARPAESNPISRGLYLLREVLCVDVPPPPQGVEIPDLPPVQEGVSTRERLQAHVADPICAACHSLIDPAGYAFESFDEVGRFRTMDHGRPVDTSGSLTLGKDIDGPFAVGDEFLARLADSESVRECFAEHYLNAGLSQVRSQSADACSLQTISESFTATGDLAQLAVSVAVSDSFRLRLVEGVE